MYVNSSTLVVFSNCDKCSHAAVVVTQVTGSLGAIISILGILFVLRFWNRPIVVLGQRYFLLGVFSAGAIASGFRPLLSLQFSRTFRSVPVCVLDTLMLFPVINIMVTMITVKEFRIYYVFNQARLLKRANNITPFLYLYVGLSCAVSMTIVILMYTLSPTKGYSYYRLEGPSSDRRIVWVAPCDSDPMRKQVLDGNDYFALLLSQLFFQSAIMLVVAFKARNVPSVAGECRSMYIISLVINIAFAVTFVTYFIFWRRIRDGFSKTGIGYGWGEGFMAIGLLVINAVTVYLLAFRKYKLVHESYSEIRSKFFSSKCTAPPSTNSPGPIEKTISV